MKEEQILKNYESAKAVYRDMGVDTDKVLGKFKDMRISVHCWQGDDIRGFESEVAPSENVVTGNYPGAARTPTELRADLEQVLKNSPVSHKVNLHSVYAEPKKPTSRENLDVSAFSNWIEWAKKNKVGLDYNGSFFAHKMMDNGLSVTSQKKEVRDFWIRHLETTREIAYEMGKSLNDVCVNNIWFPDGLKDNPADRKYWRELLKDSLDKGLKKKYDKKHLVDTLEAKVFGIGTECFVAGSYDFYIPYCIKNGLGICLDTGHFHPTESIADKLSSLSLFFDDILLHISRGVRWDSDHVTIYDDTTASIMTEANRAGILDKLHIGLDYFDASINRIFAWTVGLRSSARAMLNAMLEPVDMLKKAERADDFGLRLALTEEAKAMPSSAVWDMACLNTGAAVGSEWIKDVQDYSAKVISKR